MRNLVICLAIAIFVALFYVVFIEGPPISGATLVLCLLLFALSGIRLFKTLFGNSEEENTEDKD